jgi:ABC-type multidrug transport system ATPase subunit
VCDSKKWCEVLYSAIFGPRVNSSCNAARSRALQTPSVRKRGGSATKQRVRVNETLACAALFFTQLLFRYGLDQSIDTAMEPRPKSIAESEVLEERDNDTQATEDDPRKLKNGPPQPASVRRVVSTTASHHDNVISLHEVEPVCVRLEHLTVSVDESPNAIARLFAKKKTPPSHSHAKTILDDISAEMPSGTLTAIIGGSGSGKTSLLNQMSGRMQGKRLSCSGRTYFNKSHDPSQIRSAYVIQQDILLPTLTVRETLMYAAQLRLPSSVSQAERKQLVEEVILELSLKEAADTRIGNHAHKGCSGGEKRRTSIGVQLLSNPSLLWLDEPTTGLDSTSAYQVIKTLQNLARRGRTIIVTIHQPRSEIFGLFDNIILLTRGSPAYAGSAKDCLPYFAQLGHEMPPFTNPAEYLIDLVSIDSRNEEAEVAAEHRVNHIKNAWREHLSKIANEKDELGSNAATGSVSQSHAKRVQKTSLVQQIRVLTARTWIVTIRDPMGMFGSLLEAVAMAVITGWIFLNVDGSLSGIRSRQGALYNAAALQGYLILLYETYRLTTDIQLFDEERRQGVVSIPAFLISRRLARLFIEDIPVPLIFSIIYYFMCGFRADGEQFLTFFSVVLLLQYISVCFAMTCIAVSRNFAGASLVANLAYTLQSMGCGFFIQSNTIPIYVRWTKWTCYLVSLAPALLRLLANCITSSTRSVPLLQTSLPDVFTIVRLKVANRTLRAKSTLESSS